MPKLTKAKIAKAIKKYVVRFTHKCKAFSILQTNIEDVVKKSTQIWKLIYGLTIVKKGEVEPLEIKDGDEDDEDKEDDDKEDDDKDNLVGNKNERR